MQDTLIKKEISEILSSEGTIEEKTKAFESFVEQVKIAYYIKGQNDVSRINAKIRKERAALVAEQEKQGKVVSLDFAH